MTEDALHDDRILDRRDEAQAPAARAGENVDRQHPAEKVAAHAKWYRARGAARGTSVAGAVGSVAALSAR
ncbi:MAG: hypothetical protein HY271_04655 [Deltaproteobacteria bacterium]|nr:hypothetical protein [Deltaproteobacteria bacterium]